jgi:hypothetical protein
MQHKYANWLGVFAIGVLVAGCAHFTAPLTSKSIPGTAQGYVYGRFWLIGLTSTIHLRMGMVVEQQGTYNSYTIEFDEKNDPIVINVKPGTYVIKKFVYASWNYESEGESVINSGPLAKPFVVEAGKMYYAADFVGRINTSSEGRLIRHSYRVDSVEDHYDRTTEDLRRLYPNFQPFEANRIFVSKAS